MIGVVLWKAARPFPPPRLVVVEEDQTWWWKRTSLAVVPALFCTFSESSVIPQVLVFQIDRRMRSRTVVWCFATGSSGGVS